MKFRLVCFLLFLSISFSFLNDAHSQDTSLVFGNKIVKTKANYYDFSDPLKVNFEVIAWGGFKYPGKYLVPEGTTLIDLVTFAGFPPNSDLLTEVKLLRARDITSKYVSGSEMKFNYKKFFEKETTNYTTENPLVKPGDIVIIPMETDKTFWDYFKDGLFLIGPLASILSLIITINNSKN